jgi:putative inorganic carbon (hco3(-)) transporter
MDAVQTMPESSRGNAGIRTSVSFPQVGNAALLMFCSYVFLWYLQVGYRIAFLGTIRFEFLFAAALTVVAFMFTPKYDAKCPLFTYVVVYLLVLATQIPFSYDQYRSFDVFVDRIIKFAFMAFFIVYFVRSPRHLKFFLAAFLLACFKMGQEGLVGRISGALIWENQGIMRLHGSTPLYVHPNSFSGMALGTLPFVYFLWPISRKYTRAFLLILALLSVNIILYTGSRTGYVGIMAFFAFIFIASKNKLKILALLTLLSLVCLPMVPNDYVERFSSIFTLKEKEGHSSEARIVILKDAIEIFSAHPLGVGISAFPKIRFDTFGRVQDTHNLYLEIATNLGIQGFIVFSLLVFKMMKYLKTISGWAKRSSEFVLLHQEEFDQSMLSDLKLIEATASATLAFIVIRLALGLFGMDLYEIYWWFAIGLTFALYAMMQNISRVEQFTVSAAPEGAPLCPADL